MKWLTRALASASGLAAAVLAGCAFAQEPIRIAYIEGLKW
jgi:hypothetical protein